MDNRSISHTRWKCQYHIVFIPKYRKKVLYGKVREDVREILNTLCKYKNPAEDFTYCCLHSKCTTYHGQVSTVLSNERTFVHSILLKIPFFAFTPDNSI